MKDLGSMMEQAQRMQKKMQQAQKDSANKKVLGCSGAGLVSIEMNGRHDVTKVQVDDSVLSESKELLEDLIAAAVNDAVRKVEENNQQMFSGMAEGMQMPPGFKMPF